MPYRAPWTPPCSLGALALVIIVAGCGDSATDPEEAAPRVTTVVVRSEASTLKAIGQTARVTAAVLDQRGRPMVDVPVNWISSAPLVAAVDEDGVVTAVGEGEATIRAEAAGVGAELDIAVVQEVAQVVLSPAALRFPTLGGIVRVVAEARDANGHAVAGANFAWSSSDPAVAVVDGTGLVHAVGEGEAAIAAEADGFAGEAPLLVVQCADESVEIPRIDDAPFYRYFDLVIPLDPDSTRMVLDAPGGDRELMAAVLAEAGVSVNAIRTYTGGSERVAEISPATSLADARAAVEVLREDVRLTFVSLGYRIPASGYRILPVNRLIVQFHDDATLEEITCLNYSAGMTLERERDDGRLVWLAYPGGAEPLSVAEFYHLHPLTEWAEPDRVGFFQPQIPPRSRGPLR